jgi:DNA modification methylase
MSEFSVVQCPAESPPDEVADGSVKLVWTDPPFGTGKVQRQAGVEYKDHNDTDYVLDGLGAWIPKLHDDGTMVVLADYRLLYDAVPYLKSQGLVLRGEVVWEFGLGRPRTSWWPNRHNTMVTFTKKNDSGQFDASANPRVKRIAKSPGYPDTKPSGSVWNRTMSNSSPERVGYPNQKPMSIIIPFIEAHTDKGDLVADPFCGSSAVGHAALSLGRRYFGTDASKNAVDVSTERLVAL